MRERHPRPSPALIVSVVALVAALAGTAAAADPQATTAAKKVTKKQVKKIANRQIDKRLPLGTNEIADAAITQQKLAAGSVSTGKIQDGAVTIGKLADNSVSSAKLRDGSVRSDALGALTRRQDTQAIDPGNADSAQAVCQSGERLLSGGAGTSGVGTDPDWRVIRSGPSGNGWDAAAANGTADQGTLIAIAICLEAG